MKEDRKLPNNYDNNGKSAQLHTFSIAAENRHYTSLL